MWADLQIFTCSCQRSMIFLWADTCASWVEEGERVRNLLSSCLHVLKNWGKTWKFLFFICFILCLGMVRWFCSWYFFFCCFVWGIVLFCFVLFLKWSCILLKASRIELMMTPIELFIWICLHRQHKIEMSKYLYSSH